MILSDLEWISEMFNGMKHRAVSLRHLSFFLVEDIAKRRATSAGRGKWPNWRAMSLYSLRTVDAETGQLAGSDDW